MIIENSNRNFIYVLIFNDKSQYIDKIIVQNPNVDEYSK